MLDLAKKNFAEIAEKGYEFEVKLPTGENSGAFITVRGSQSKTVKAYNRRMLQEYQQKVALAKRKGRDPEQFDIDEMEKAGVESAIVRVIGWRGITEGGKDVPFTKENADRIFTEHTWIADQVREESDQILNFRAD